MRRPQFSLKTLLWLMLAACALAGAAGYAWRFVQPIIHPHPVRTWTVQNGEMIEQHTEWSNGAHSIDGHRKDSPVFATEAEFQAAIQKAAKEQADSETQE
jgi:hypothetical protein